MKHMGLRILFIWSSPGHWMEILGTCYNSIIKVMWSDDDRLFTREESGPQVSLLLAAIDVDK
jgi:hypothetical protein